MNAKPLDQSEVAKDFFERNPQIEERIEQAASRIRQWTSSPVVVAVTESEEGLVTMGFPYDQFKVHVKDSELPAPVREILKNPPPPGMYYLIGETNQCKSLEKPVGFFMACCSFDDTAEA